MTARLAAILWIAGAVVYFAVEAVAASALPGYGYATDYISTLGDPASSPRAPLMNAAFVVQGLCFAAGAVLILAAMRAAMSRNWLWFLAFAVINGGGNVLLALVTSGTGSAWHIVGAGLAIAGGNCAAIAGSATLAPMLGSRAHRVASIALGALGLLCLLVVAVGTTGAIPHVAVWERGSVYPIFAWQVLTAVYVLRRQPG